MSAKDNIERIKELITKYQLGTATDLEIQELYAWRDHSDANFNLFNLWQDSDGRREHLVDLLTIESRAAKEGKAWEAKMPKEIKEQFLLPSKTIFLRRFLYAAAAVVFLLFFSYKFLLRQPVKDVQSKELAKIQDIPAPKGTRSTLTLSNGSEIALDDVQNGVLTHQGNTVLVKSASGQLEYEASKDKESAIVFNTLATSRGGQAKLTLADGTKVWLDAASSLRYPTAFHNSNRTVELTGQAYFEVTKNTAMPFMVKTAFGSEIDVLGTNFNVNAYGDNHWPVIASLLQGSIRLSSGTTTKKIKPGQDASLTTNHEIVVSNNDVKSVIAWKDGYFRFKGADIETVMHSLSRWYNVNVRFEGDMSGNLLTAQVKRAHNASDVLKVLAVSGYNFKIEDSTIVVLP